LSISAPNLSVSAPISIVSAPTSTFSAPHFNLSISHHTLYESKHPNLSRWARVILSIPISNCTAEGDCSTLEIQTDAYISEFWYSFPLVSFPNPTIVDRVTSLTWLFFLFKWVKLVVLGLSTGSLLLLT
jgi:hypothetical protein